MNKGIILEFHQTFLAETGCIAKILQLAAENVSGTTEEVSKVGVLID